MSKRRLYRSPKDKLIGGVCGGLGHYFHIDPVVMRILVVIIFIITGLLPVLIAYIIMWAVIPLYPIRKRYNQNRRPSHRSRSSSQRPRQNRSPES